MISLWEKQSFLQSDIVIVGAGITGLSAAASLKESKPDLSITILESGILPTGASTKNAGFACFGSVSELLNDFNAIGEEGMVQLVEKRWRGLQKTIQRLGERTIDLKVNGGYELVFEEDAATIDQIEPINDLLEDFFTQRVYRRSDEKINEFGLADTKHLIENTLEGQLDTGKLISSLWKYCASLGVKIHTGCKVDSVEETGRKVEIKCGEFIFQCNKVGICTNAFSNALLTKEVDLSPGRGMVLTVVPEKPLALCGTYHYHEGYYYFRDYYGKLIFGGGRNLDLEAETTTNFEVNQSIKEQLIEDLQTIIIPNQSFQIAMEWTGIMAFGETKEPLVEMISENVGMGVRLGGMGVAIGSLVGHELAKLLFPKP